MLGREDRTREYFLKLEQDVVTNRLKIYFGYEAQDGLHLLMPTDGTMLDKLVPDNIAVEPKEGEYSPIITLGRRSAEAFLQKIAAAISNRGIRTDTESKLEGELEATKKHLEDMRTLALR